MAQKLPPLKLVIGPDEQEGGTAWVFARKWDTGTWARFDSDGSRGTVRNTTPAGWIAYAKRHVRLPKGYTWAGYDSHRINSYTRGADHAPHGITIFWE